MSEEMAPSWRSLASAASRSFKGYIAQQRELKQSYPSWRGPPSSSQDSDATPKKQSWSQWAGQKLRRGSQSQYDVSGDRISLFPGWATRRYREPQREGQEDTPFDVDVFVSGYACKLTGVGFNTRAGRTFLRLAKSYAALPKLPLATGVAAGAMTPMSRSTEDLLAHAHLPPPPDEMTDESEMQVLDDKLRRLEFDARSFDSGHSGHDTTSLASSSDSHGSSYPLSASSATSFSSSRYGHSQQASSESPPASATPSGSGSGSGSGSSDLHRWHANLEARLHPFWSSALSNRTVRVSLYAADPSLYDGGDASTDESASSESSIPPEKQPVLTREVVTTVDGSFQIKFSVPWEQMCVHPAALHIAFGGPELEQDLFVVAELLAPPSSGPATPTTPQGPPRHIAPSRAPVTTATSIAIPLSYSSVRVISDIDDTVKLSGILGGARAVFHNVFVKDLRDSVIRGMGDWYMNMWKRGVRFHYVSNGPFELLPVVNEFLQISRLPPGSIRLRSYGGRSLFNGLLSAPAMRKRAGVLDVLNHFPESHFILVGDSGEQDLELYADIARERPDQIVGIFIRDASARGEDARPLEDPTGAEAYRGVLEGGLGMPSSAPVDSAGGSGVRGAGRRLTARYGPGASRSMSDATPVPTPIQTTAPSMSEGSAPRSARNPARTRSGSDPDLGGLGRGGASAGAAGSTGAPPYDYFSSAPRTHSPITEEPGASPEMGVPPRAHGSGEWGQTPQSGRWQPQRIQTQHLQRQKQQEEQPPTPTSAGARSQPPSPVSDAEKRRWELQARVWKARVDVPPHIPIRVFREPEECVEVDGILDRLQVRARS
ncbi:hypothetical protein C8Q77DRAFT_1160159 [Trametes polyzona]|nr:hypothetical protein C8Q77DRAFT_1160159 [Trametes polyzona]